jgi:2'-5' RNA ligase
MKTIVQSIPGYRINEYMVILNPPEDLRNKISQVKKDFSETYKTNINTAGKSHIMLAAFTQYAMLEDRLLNRLKTVAMGIRPFKVELKDYKSFPSHTVYIDITTREPFRNIVKELRDFQQLMKLNKDNKPYFPDEPYITIARKLVPWQFEKGWQEYAHRHFTGRFIADSMLVVKRRQGEKAWQIAARFDFMDIAVNSRQGQLF